jgi:hypothetical protein
MSYTGVIKTDVSVTFDIELALADAPDHPTSQTTMMRPESVRLRYFNGRRTTPQLIGRRILKSGELGAEVRDTLWDVPGLGIPDWVRPALDEADRLYRASVIGDVYPLEVLR